MPTVLRVMADDEADDLAGRGWTTAESLRVRPRTWLLPDRLVAEAVVIVEGDPQAGKSSWLSGLAAAVSTGAAFCGRPRQAPADLLWCAGEEIYDVDVTPRLVGAGADMSRVHYPIDPTTNEPLLLSVPEHTRQIQAALQAYQATVLVLDPLVCYVSPDCDLRTEGGARAVMDALGALARRCKCTVIVLRHLKKGRSGPRILWGFGSAAVSGAARSIVQVERPDTFTERRVVRTVRCAGGGQVDAAEFFLDRSGPTPLVTRWRELPGGDQDVTLEDDTPIGRSARASAERMLREMLASGEEVPAKRVLAAADEYKIGWRTVETVKLQLKIRSRFDGKAVPALWYWQEPEGGFPATDTALRPCGLDPSSSKKPRKKQAGPRRKGKAARPQGRVDTPPVEPDAPPSTG